MADNTELGSASGGDNIRTEDHSGSGPKTPVSLIDVGGTGGSESIVGDSGVGMFTLGMAAENAAATGNPVLVGGRFDSTPRVLGDLDVGAIALDADGAVHISDGGNSITIDGTVTADAGSGTFTVDGSGVTQPISAVSLPLPSGASTLAAQLPDGHNVTVDNAAGASAVNIQDGGNIITVDGTVTANAGTGTMTVDNGGTFVVQENGTALTRLTDIETNTDYGTTIGGGTEAAALRVTIANNSTGVLTVDNGGTFVVQSTLQAGTAEFGKLAAGVAEIGNVANSGTFATQATLQAGTAAFGKLSANDGVDIGDVDVATQPARAATVDNAGAALMTNVIHSGTTALTPAFAVVNGGSSGDNTLVAAGTNKIRVLSLMLVSTGTVGVQFESGAGGTPISGRMDLVANTGFVLPFNPVGWFETASATLLNMDLDAAVPVDGVLTYVDVA